MGSDVPCLNLNMLWPVRWGRLVASNLRTATLPRSRFSGFDPHTLSAVGWRRSLNQRFRFRDIRIRRSFRASRFTAILFLFQQKLHAAGSPADALPGGVLDLIAAVAILLPSLACVTELAAETFRSIIQAPAQELFWGGSGLFLQALLSRRFLFDFSDAVSPPNEKKGRKRGPFCS